MEVSIDSTGGAIPQDSLTPQQQEQQSLVDRMNRRLSPRSSPTTLPSIDQSSSTHKRAYGTSTTSERGTATLASLPTIAINNNSLGLGFSSLGGGGSGAVSLGCVSSNNERSAVVLALFGPSVGPSVGDFSTSYNRVNGRLYASTKAILFYSNLFGFERRLCLQLSDVTDIDFYRATSIRVSMVDCEDYIFKRIQDRDHVLSILKELLYREQQLQPSSLTGTMMPLPIILNHTPTSISSTSSTTSSGPTTSTTGGFKFRRPSSMSGLRRGRMMSNDEMTNRKTIRTLMSSSSLLPIGSSGSNHNGSYSERPSRPHLSSDISEPEHTSPSTSMRRRSKSVPSVFPPLVADESGGGDDSELGDSFSGDLPMTPTMIQRKGAVPFEGFEHLEESENYDDDDNDIVNPPETGSIEVEYNNGANRPSLAVLRSLWDRLKEPLEEVHVEVSIYCIVCVCMWE
jgi:hypothetical protein